jgi:hypothetical protein
MGGVALRGKIPATSIINVPCGAAWLGLAWFSATALSDVTYHGAAPCGLSGVIVSAVCELHWLAMCLAMMLPSDKRALLQLVGGNATVRKAAAAVVGYAFLWALAGGVLRVFDAHFTGISDFFRFMPLSTVVGVNVWIVVLWIGFSVVSSGGDEEPAQSSRGLLGGMTIARASLARCWPIMLLCYYQESVLLMSAFTVVVIVTDRLVHRASGRRIHPPLSAQ